MLRAAAAIADRQFRTASSLLCPSSISPVRRVFLTKMSQILSTGAARRELGWHRGDRWCSSRARSDALLIAICRHLSAMAARLLLLAAETQQLLGTMSVFPLCVAAHKLPNEA